MCDIAFYAIIPFQYGIDINKYIEFFLNVFNLFT